LQALATAGRFDFHALVEFGINAKKNMLSHVAIMLDCVVQKP